MRITRNVWRAIAIILAAVAIALLCITFMHVVNIHLMVGIALIAVGTIVLLAVTSNSSVKMTS
ncbi:MAG: hypothetical protein K6G47_00970 [Clostridia bacterium]|nr:hypothetical protein [Clostridia bacterium]